VRLEVGHQFQDMVDRLEQRAAGLVAAPTTNANGHPTATSSDVLLVDGAKYHVVQALLFLLGILGDSLAFRDAVPAFGAEVAQRVLELLKIFNSKSCQLVLGAGAMQVAGLKSITAKHLAVSCQCLGALIALHPAVEVCFTEGVMEPRKGMLSSDFTRVQQVRFVFLAILSSHHIFVCIVAVVPFEEFIYLFFTSVFFLHFRISPYTGMKSMPSWCPSCKTVWLPTSSSCQRTPLPGTLAPQNPTHSPPALLR
jgi:hypothetical protein